MITLDRDRLDWVREIRRELHKEPELSFKEYKTTERIINTLKSLGVLVTPLPDITGAIGLVEGEKKGPCLALRADIDALPIQEKTGRAYASISPGQMHACGHDANTAIMMGVAYTLAKEKPQFRGSAKLIFQPSEERYYGAKTVIEKGALENPRVDRIIAGHMAPNLDIGTIGIFRTVGYAAADLFSITIEGQGGHGGRPHETCDPLVAGASLVTALQTLVSRNVQPTDPAVVSVGKFIAGSVGNIIPEIAELEGTIRTLSDKARDTVITRMGEICRGVETAYGVSCRLKITPETPCCRNDESVSQELFAVAEDLLGPGNVVWMPPTMGSEDFAYFTEARPGAIVRLGCRNSAKTPDAPLHSPYFDIDEDVLEIGVQFFMRALKTYLA